jgi:hypothetical protein
MIKTIGEFDPKDKKGPRSYDSWKVFSYFLQGIDALADLDNKANLNALEEKFEYTNIPLWNIRNLFRDGYKNGTLNFSNLDDPKVLYLSRCLGHKISETKFLKFPRLCVLYSLCILKDRWRYAEPVIGRDDVAAYFYSKYVICGQLPEKMHTEIVLRTFVSKSPAIEKYFSCL